MNIHLINLDRSTDRLANFHAVNSHLANVIRQPAFDGSKQDIPSLVANGIIEQAAATSYYRPAAIGAALSHAALWSKAIDSQESLTICEDDAIFGANYMNASAELIGTLPSDWDLVLWGWNFEGNVLFQLMSGVSRCLCHFDWGLSAARVEAFRSGRLAAQAFRLINAFGIPAYSISPKGARTLKERCFPLRAKTVHFPVVERHIPNVGIDVAMNEVYGAMKAYIAFPPLVITRNELQTSTIQRA